MAYIDPGVGSLIVQILAAGAIGAVFYLKRIVARGRSFFRRARNNPSSD